MFKFLLSFLLILGAFTGTANATAVDGDFSKVIYVAVGPTSTQSARNSGRDYASPKAFIDGDLFTIPANVNITNVYVVIDTAIVGLTAFNLGDDDASSGFIASSSPATAFGSTGVLYWDEQYKGSYLFASARNYSKFYSLATKILKLDVTGTASAGRMRIFLSGKSLGPAQ